MHGRMLLEVLKRVFVAKGGGKEGAAGRGRGRPSVDRRKQRFDHGNHLRDIHCEGGTMREYRGAQGTRENRSSSNPRTGSQITLSTHMDRTADQRQR